MPWQQELQQLITTPESLLALTGLDCAWLPAAETAARLFPLRATISYIERIEKGNPEDPLLRQILPLGYELGSPLHYSGDPLAERTAAPLPGLVHKYKSRVLLISSSQCAINCRYCFRRSFPYSEHRPNRQQWTEALNYIENHPQVNEVILSGGDPLSVNDRELAWLINAIAGIGHIKRLRIHTRIPIVLPSRVTTELLDVFRSAPLKTLMVIHCNHANEIDAGVVKALGALRGAGLHLLNQSVLLRGVNDRVEALAALSETLFAADVLPYYLHLLDPVKGASHFEVPLDEAQALYRSLLAELPGFLVPKLVREIPGVASKSPIAV